MPPTTTALVAKLGKLLNAPPISIELIPGDGSEWLAADMPAEASQHVPFLFIDGNLGVPKKVAYRIYLEGLLLFRRCRASLRIQPTPSSAGLSQTYVQGMLVSSAVLLLVTPAHQSALNARKWLVQNDLVDAKKELSFVSALLTLREGAKQSLLWRYRRWLLRRVYSAQASRPELVSEVADAKVHGIRGDEEDSLLHIALNAKAFRTEFGIVAQACETYPRNFYAWTHRYLCAEALAALIVSQGLDSGLVEAWQEERVLIRGWIERHVSDYSAMQYACRLEVLGGQFPGLEPTAKPSRRGDGGIEALPEAGETVCGHAWSLVKAYPTHESLWSYLRGALSPSFAPGGPHPRVNIAQHAKVLNEARTLAEGILRDEREGSIRSVLPGERDLLRNHAVRFLAWVLWKEKKVEINGETVRRIAAVAEGEATIPTSLLDYLCTARSV